jgi:hypothetical protein
MRRERVLRISFATLKRSWQGEHAMSQIPNTATALANKLARIAWAVLAKGRAFELTRTDDAGVVRMRNTRTEQMFSASPPNSDIV